MARQAQRRAATKPSTDLLDRIGAEIELRLDQLRPAVKEREQLIEAAAALGLEAPAEGAAVPDLGRRSSRAAAASRPARASARRRKSGARGAPSPRGATQQAIVAALEHGSHTLAELALVTAQGAPRLRRHLAALLERGAVTRARRDGRRAYALPGAESS